ncbi:MAG: guanylate kinase [Omnitrophica bacterium GWA2_52_8]|nr:MAG: guanylate kinase [Omnitrophica bacterium GWA2_52_8]
MSTIKKKTQQGLLVILSAPSGCGKTTIVDRLLKRHEDRIRAVSVTTRKPRLGEKDGVDYFFVTREAFKKMEKAGELLESAKVFDEYYGTPKSFVREQLKSGKTVILAIDVQGAKILRTKAALKGPQFSIFVLPPSVKVLRDRLEGRRTDSPEEIEKRLQIAQEEIKEAGSYDRTVMNQNLDQTVLEIERLMDEFLKKKSAVHAA